MLLGQCTTEVTWVKTMGNICHTKRIACLLNADLQKFFCSPGDGHLKFFSGLTLSGVGTRAIKPSLSLSMAD